VSALTLRDETIWNLLLVPLIANSPFLLLPQISILAMIVVSYFQVSRSPTEYTGQSEFKSANSGVSTTEVNAQSPIIFFSVAVGQTELTVYYGAVSRCLQRKR
jgi:hypothetical protein